MTKKPPPGELAVPDGYTIETAPYMINSFGNPVENRHRKNGTPAVEAATVTGDDWPEDAPTTPQVEKRREQVSAFDELFITRSGLIDLPRGVPLITDVVDRHTIFVVAGRDQTYKSFLVLDWLCCLATGTSWMGRRGRADQDALRRR